MFKDFLKTPEKNYLKKKKFKRIKNFKFFGVKIYTKMLAIYGPHMELNNFNQYDQIR